VVADASEMFLTDPESIRQIAENNKSLARKIVDFLKDFTEKLKSVLSDLEPKSRAAKLLNQDLMLSKTAEEMWIEALNDASGTNTKAVKGENSQANKVKEVFSLKEPVEETKDLIAVHNLSENKLEKVLELGGFAVPSIAITKAEYGHKGYGDISVLFSKDTINPDDVRNLVYTQDVYSKTVPRVKNRQTPLRFEKMNALFAGYFKKLGMNINSYSNQWENKGIDDAANELKYKEAVKLAYLDSIGIDYTIPMKNVSLYQIQNEELAEEFWRNHPDFSSSSYYNDRDKWYDAIYELAVNDAEKTIAELKKSFATSKRPGLLEKRIEQLQVPDKLGLMVLDRYERDLLMRKDGNATQEIDDYKVKDDLKEILSGKEDEFESWIKKTISPYYGEKYFDADGKKIPYDLSSLTEYMKGRVVGQQKTMVWLGECNCCYRI
jgi:hypothetical protein